jgi:hypothetical protein
MAEKRQGEGRGGERVDRMAGSGPGVTCYLRLRLRGMAAPLSAAKGSMLRPRVCCFRSRSASRAHRMASDYTEMQTRICGGVYRWEQDLLGKRK